MNYAGHAPSHVDFMPPDSLMGQWEGDYTAKWECTFYGKTIEFSKLIERMHELKNRFRLIKLPSQVSNDVTKNKF